MVHDSVKMPMNNSICELQIVRLEEKNKNKKKKDVDAAMRCDPMLVVIPKIAWHMYQIDVINR